MMALPSSYQERYWQAIRSLEKEHKMEWLSPLEQSFLDKGREEGLKRGLREGRKEGWEDGLEKGLAKGLEKGRKEGAVAVLERQLTRRFGPLSETTRKKLTRASLPQLEAWGDALPEAQTLKQVFG
jgi:flagellar biosynthesis/type III secretory pathway protein FliH